MNFSLFVSVFVVAGLGPWATAKDVFIHLRKNRFDLKVCVGSITHYGGTSEFVSHVYNGKGYSDLALFLYNHMKEVPAEETKRKQAGDFGPPVVGGWAQTASKARSWTQWLRRLLKALRKWCRSHPPEVKLGKCFAKHFNIDIAGTRLFEKVGGHNGESKVTQYPRKTSKVRKMERATTQRDYCTQKNKSRGIFLWNEMVSSFGDFLRETRNQISHYGSVIFRNELAVCLWEYLDKKFWMWVDSAPDTTL